MPGAGSDEPRMIMSMLCHEPLGAGRADQELSDTTLASPVRN
jgi:hypothetical protein